MRHTRITIALITTSLVGLAVLFFVAIPHQAEAGFGNPPRDVHLCDGTVLKNVKSFPGLHGETEFKEAVNEGVEEGVRRQFTVSSNCGYWYETTGE